jgi:release factor glutamine methyltransferase
MWHVTASDISQSALEIADQNASDLGASIELVRSDAFEQFEGRRFDAIVTNPPYIGLCEPLSEVVKDFEPSQALFGGPTGMEFYELLANKGRQHLEGGGKLFMEVGYRQAQAVATLFAALGWTVVDIVPDLSGVSRVVVCSN